MAGEKDILAPLSGKIVAVQIEIGQAVQEEDESFVIEAMKMETSVYVPCDGTVKKIGVSPGGEVEEDDVLGIIEYS